jgi:hypothetical protein
MTSFLCLAAVVTAGVQSVDCGFLGGNQKSAQVLIACAAF